MSTRGRRRKVRSRPKSVYKTKYAEQIRWALDLAQRNLDELFDDTLVEIANNLCEFISSCDYSVGARSALPGPTVSPGEDLMRLILGADPFLDKQPQSKARKALLSTSRTSRLYLNLKEASQHLKDIFSPLMALADQDRKGAFPIEVTATFGSIFYQVSAETPTRPFRVSLHHVSPERFPGVNFNQLLNLALVSHLAHSRLTPSMIRKCPVCNRVFLPKRKSRVAAPFHSRECNQSMIETKRPKRPRAGWLRFKSFLTKARKCSKGSATDQFIEKQLGNGWKIVRRWIKLSDRSPDAEKKIWQGLPEKTRRAFSENWEALWV